MICCLFSDFVMRFMRLYFGVVLGYFPTGAWIGSTFSFSSFHHLYIFMYIFHDEQIAMCGYIMETF